MVIRAKLVVLAQNAQADSKLVGFFRQISQSRPTKI